jgi:hypothetical protein
MPLQRTETYTTTGTKGSWNCDPSIAPFQVNVAAILSDAGTVDYKLQYSYDTLDGPALTDSDASWIDSDDIPGGTTTTAEANFSTPIARVRIVIAALSGSLKVTMLQGFSIN